MSASLQWLPLLLVWSASGAYPPWHIFEGLNAVSHCPNTCIDSDPFRCLGLFPGANASACINACISDGNCSQATWAKDDGRCFTRTDGEWNLVAGGTVAACDNRTVPGCAPAPPVNGTVITATVADTPSGRLHPLAPAVTLDFWNASTPGVGPKWGPSSVLMLNLTHPALLSLASALAPGLLRLGGSPEDSVIFDTDGTCVAGTGGVGPAPGGYFCSQTRPYVYGCLTRARWAELLAFANATGLRLVLGLNGCYGRLAADTPMDFSNARALLEATAASPHAASVYGFELSNEVVGTPDEEGTTVRPAAWAADVATLRSIVAAVFGAAGLPAPMLAGPDIASPGTMTAVLAASAPVQAITYHHYAACEPGQFFFLLEPACLQVLDQWAAMYAAIAAAAPGAGGPVAAWAGETAEHGGGGVPGLTDSFTSTLYYAWQLGALPPLGIELSARQALVGGDYELLQRVTMVPNPDFWLLYLFKALAGGGSAAFPVTTSAPAATTGVRVFAFSATAATGARRTLLALSLNSVGAAVEVRLEGQGLDGPRVEYHLTGQPGVGGAPVRCNGVQLAVGADGAPPPWRGLGVPAAAGSALLVGASSVVLATVA